MGTEKSLRSGALSTHSTAKPPTVWAGRIATAILVVSFVLVPCGWGQTLKDNPHGIKLLQAIILSGWTVGIPIWFWIEFHWIGTTMEDLEQLKYSQELSSKVWLACTSVLFLLYFWKDIK
jgi:hypothetical protein